MLGKSPLAVASLGFLMLTRAGTDSLLLVLIGAGVLAAGLVSVMTMAGEVVLSSLRPDQAGSGSAVSESATELGGALGIALLGSVGAAGYRSFAEGRLPGDLADGSAAGSLPGALAVAGQLPAELAEQVLAVARNAFLHGLHLASITGAAVLALAAIAVLVEGRRRPVRGRDGGVAGSD